MQTPLQMLKLLQLLFMLVLLAGCATSEKPVISVPSANLTSTVNRNAAREALQLQGHPYVPGGESPGEGFDCSGLVFYVYKKHGLKLPRDTHSLINALPSVRLEQRQPGDLLFFSINAKPHAHVGIYVGEDNFVHASSDRIGRVMVSNLKQTYWRERFSAVRRPQILHTLSLHNSAENSCLQN